MSETIHASRRIIHPITVLDVGFGHHERWSIVDKFGKSATIGTSFKPISNGGSAVLLTSAETLDVVSDDANDDLTGTGAQKIEIQGLDANFTEISETVDLDGTTPVTTTNSFIRFFRAFVTQVGSATESTNLGELTISASTTTTATLIILAEEGQSQTAQYTIPANKTGYLEKIFFTSDSANVIIGQLQVRPFGQGWQTKHELVTTNEHVSADMAGSGGILEKSDIRWMAKASTGPSNDATAGFKVLLRDN